MRNARAVLLLVLPLTLLLWQPSFARVSEVEVTQKNQKEQDLNFQVFSIKLSSSTYSIQCVVPQEGKLEKLSGAALVLYDGKKMILSVPLQETPPLDDRTMSLKFFIGTELLDKATLSLACCDGMRLVSYNIRLATYVDQGKLEPAPRNNDTTVLREPPDTAPHGVDRDGVSLGLWSEQDRYVLGTPINAWIMLRNARRDKNGHVIPYSSRIFEDSYLFVTRPDGTMVQAKQGGPVDGPHGMGFTGGVSDSLSRLLTKPGLYKVKWKIGQLESNEVAITVVDNTR